MLKHSAAAIIIIVVVTRTITIVVNVAIIADVVAGLEGKGESLRVQGRINCSS